MAEDDRKRKPPTEETPEFESISDLPPASEKTETRKKGFELPPLPDLAERQLLAAGRVALQDATVRFRDDVLSEALRSAVVKGGDDYPKIDASDVDEGKGHALRRMRIVDERQRQRARIAQKFLDVAAGTICGLVFANPAPTRTDLVLVAIASILFSASYACEWAITHRW